MTAAPPLRTALIGAGWVSTNRHLPALAACPDTEPVAIMAPPGTLRPDRRDDLLARYPGIEVVDTVDALERSSPEAVMIGTPPGSHPENAVDALRRGYHVLTEKPFAPTVAAADAMIAAADAADRRLAVVHNLAFGRASAAARRAIERGTLGELRGVMGVQSSNHRRRLPTWYRELPLGLFTDESPHLLYLVDGFLPEATTEAVYVGAPLADDDHTPDLVQLTVRDGPVIGTVTMTFVGAVSEWILVLLGSRGTMVLDFFRDVAFRLPDDGRHEALDVLRTQFAATAGHLASTARAGSRRLRGRLDYGNEEVVRRFAAAVRTGVEDPVIGGRRARRVVERSQHVHEVAASRPAGRGSGRPAT